MSSFLEGERVRLRPLEPADSEYYHFFNDPEICAGNSHCVYPMTEAHALQYINGIYHSDDALVLAIVGDGIHIGNIALQNIHAIYRSSELALIIFDKMHWGMGYGTEACNLIINHAWNALNLHRITCGTFSTNVGMMRLAEKLGFVQEGVRKEAAWKNGEWVDVVEYGLLNI